MKHYRMLLGGICAVILALPHTAVEAAPPKRPAGPPDPLASATDASPAQQLAPYIQHIDQLLALRRRPNDARALDQAQGRLALIKQSFTTQRAAATGAERAKLDAAIATTQRLSAALDERTKTLAQINASAAVRSSDDLGERRRDSLTSGPATRGKARAARVELARERREAVESRREAAERDEAMTARSVQRWNDRATELRKQITDAYNRIPTT